MQITIRNNPLAKSFLDVFDDAPDSIQIDATSILIFRFKTSFCFLLRFYI